MMTRLLLLLPILCLLSGIVYLSVKLFILMCKDNPLKPLNPHNSLECTSEIPMTIDVEVPKTAHELLSGTIKVPIVNSYKVCTSEEGIYIYVLYVLTEKKYGAIDKLNITDSSEVIGIACEKYLPEKLLDNNNTPTYKFDQQLLEGGKMLCQLQNSN